jgi:hypothetical protein
MAATADANITLTDLDFDGIKQGLKDYIGSKSEFKDYNFEGSALSTMLDVLAYNTHYSAFYANMVANEMFLDSSVVRDSVVSHAKAVGYVPTSKKAAKSIVDVTYTDSNYPSSLIISKGSVFSGRKGNGTYNFVNTKAHAVIPREDGIAGYIAHSVPVFEGSMRAMTFIVDTNDSDQRFIIPQQDVDISHLTVHVQTSTTDSSGFTDNWSVSTDINEITSTDKVYWVQEVKNGYYEVIFGDNAIGQKLSNGNLVVLEYLITNGEDANGIGVIDNPDNRAFTTSDGGVVTVKSIADGGGEREGVDSIKFYAPRVYQAQDRAVTAEDYKSIVMKEYSTADSVYVWGGEELDPPQYGKVFISVKPKSGLLLTTEEKQYLTNTIVGKKNMVAITPDIIDPEYLYTKFTIDTTYNPTLEKMNGDGLKELIKSKIIDWSSENLGKFEQHFRPSKFVAELDKVSRSILNTNLSIKLEKRIKPTLARETNYDINFENAIHHPHDGHKSILNTTPFIHLGTDGITKYKCYLNDDGYGSIRLYTVVDGVNVYINKNQGTIDYASGKLALTRFTPVELSDNYITLRFTVTPEVSNISGRTNTVLYFDRYDASSLTVNMNAESIYKTSGTSTPRATGY